MTTSGVCNRSKNKSRIKILLEKTPNPLLCIKETAVQRVSTLFNTAEMLSRELDSSLQKEKQIRECSEWKKNDGEVYKMCNNKSEMKIHLFTSIRNTD